jgi:hypothetical protein
LNKRFIAMRNHYLEKGHPICSIDETGFGRFSYNRAFGYAKKGQQLFVRKSKPRMTSISVIACASKEGWVNYKIIKGGVNRLAFCEFVASLELPKGTVMLLDNASIHRGDVVKEMFYEKGIIPLYVPPYSPWYNPIEKCFSTVKRNFLEKEDIDFAMQNMNANVHFCPYFRNGLACNGFDNADAIENLLPEEPIVSPTQIKPIKQIKTKSKPITTSDKSEVVYKNKTPDGSTVTIKTITTIITTIRKKRA